jgi:hypothetical protein
VARLRPGRMGRSVLVGAGQCWSVLVGAGRCWPGRVCRPNESRRRPGRGRRRGPPPTGHRGPGRLGARDGQPGSLAQC